jgi:aminoglycoside phosphotransferase (APT) family kinase protein
MGDEEHGATADAEIVAGLVDVNRLSRWMDDEELPGAGEPLEVTRLSGGSQNELLALRRGDHTTVMRRPSLQAGDSMDRTMAREMRVLRAIGDSDVPHARLLAGTEDKGVVGASFYVMEQVDGWSPVAGGWQPPFDTDLDTKAGLAIELVDGIAKLSKVDWKAKGLEGFGRPDGFHERQVDRWLGFLAEYQFRELPGLETAGAWLRDHQPRSYKPGIMHGDYQFANVMFRHGAPARLAAIVDWEMATVGDPLLDLGWVLIGWPSEGEELAHTEDGPMNLRGMPPKAEVLEHYAAVSGRPVDEIDYYIVLARFKLGIVLEKSVARVRASGVPDDRVAMFDPIVLELAQKAGEMASSLS